MRQLAVIPTMGSRPDLLRRTVKSIAACDRPESFEQLIVIENGGDGSTPQTLADLQNDLPLRVEVLEQGNKSAALNWMLDQVGDALIVFFDDDVRMTPNTLKAYAEAGKAHSEGHFFGGVCHIDYEQRPPDYLIPHLPLSARGFTPNSDKPDEVFLGCNWAAFAKHLRDVGGFDPNRGPGAKTGALGQETAMQLRLISHGYRSVAVHDAVVWHYVPKDRCSKQWLIHRRYRSGLQDAHDKDLGKPILGIPALLWRQRILNVARWGRAILLPTPINRLKARFWSAQLRGALEGSRRKQ